MEFDGAGGENGNTTHHKLDTCHAIPDAGQNCLLALCVPHASHDDEGRLDSGFKKAIASVSKCYLLPISARSSPEQESHGHQALEVVGSSATANHNSPAQHATVLSVRATKKITSSSHFPERNFATGNF